MNSRLTSFRNNAQQSVRRVKARLRHAALTRAPMWLTRGRLGKLKAISDVSIIDRDISLPNLPDPLDGLRIAHLTDLHVGTLVTPQRLPEIIETTNLLRGDIIAVTGDFVDLSLDVLEPVVEAMSQLAAPLGVYFVPGNHDYLDDGDRLVRRFRDAGLAMLINESITLENQNHRVVISGIDFPYRQREMRIFVRKALRSAPRRREDDLRILLSHHPDAFDVARDHHFDLTLAGHTHGGQVVLSNARGKKGSIGIGSLAHRYPRGLYRRGHSYLYVNSGVGSWFPVRYKCPAEIACLTLRCAPEAGEAEGMSHP